MVCECKQNLHPGFCVRLAKTSFQETTKLSGIKNRFSCLLWFSKVVFIKMEISKALRRAYMSMKELPPQQQSYNCLLLFLNSALGCSLINGVPHEHSISRLRAPKQSLRKHSIACISIAAACCYGLLIIIVFIFYLAHLYWTSSAISLFISCWGEHGDEWDGVNASRY